MASEDEQREIEQAFIASWDDVEHFYAAWMQNLRYEWMQSMLDLIAELRARGYDRQFRAGQQLNALMLSRSREHGLRAGQAWFKIETTPHHGTFVWYAEPPNVRIEFEIEHVEITPEVEDLLNRLLAHPID